MTCCSEGGGVELLFRPTPNMSEGQQPVSFLAATSASQGVDIIPGIGCVGKYLGVGFDKLVS